MQRYGQLIIWMLAVVLSGCEDTSFRSSVPIYPVRLSIDTRVGEWVHFKETAINTYVTVDREGYHYNGRVVQQLAATDMWGYAGVVVYINMAGGYDAYDLCCPNCAAYRQACDIDGIFAVCPRCGEHYDLSSGTAAPQQGIAHEYLLRMNVINSDGKLTITQRR